MRLSKNKANSGQAIIIILLVAAVGLTVGISLISRSVTDVRISRQEEEQARAFSAAEAGIEKAIEQGEGISREEFGDAEYSVKATDLGKEAGFVFPKAVDQGDIKTVWLVEHADGSPSRAAGEFIGTAIDLCWGNTDQEADLEETPALEATLIYEEGGVYKVSKAVFDPNSVRATTQNNFTVAVGGCSGVISAEQSYDFPFKGTISGITGPYALRLKLIYNNDKAQMLGVLGNDILPSQGTIYDSTAVVGSGDDLVTSRVQQVQYHDAPPGIFDYVLFSEGDLEHN